MPNTKTHYSEPDIDTDKRGNVLTLCGKRVKHQDIDEVEPSCEFCIFKSESESNDNQQTNQTRP